MLLLRVELSVPEFLCKSNKILRFEINRKMENFKFKQEMNTY